MPMERADNALQNRGMIVPERGAAMADWQRFSIDLREQCFEHDEGGDHNRTGRTLHSHIQVGRGPLRFMIITGRPDFESLILPLSSSEESQIQLPTLRGAPRFRPAVLGADLRTKVATLPEPQREHLLALIAS